MTSSVKGKVAIVTGGGRGIGKAIARRLAEAGANVVIASRKLDKLQETAKEFAGLRGKTIPMACHVGRAAEIENLVRETEKHLGPVDILVNNSATNLGQGPALNVTDEALLKAIEINVLSAMRLIRAWRNGSCLLNSSTLARQTPCTRTRIRPSGSFSIRMMTPTVPIENRSSSPGSSIWLSFWATALIERSRLTDNGTMMNG